MGQEQGKGPNISSGLGFLERTLSLSQQNFWKLSLVLYKKITSFFRKDSDDNLIKVILDVIE